MKLHISNDLSLPVDAATQTFAFIARKGAGKTYAAGKLAECLLDAHVQVVILDSVGNWWGLRLMADGKSPAYDIPVIGGLRGDIPLEAAGGHLIADIIADTGRSLLIDVSQFSKADRQRFATALGERLWKNKKAERHPSPLHLIIEESQLIVPETVRGESATMVGIYEEIIRLGRNYGIGVSMISQRPQSVNKEVLNQTECLFALQVNGKHERIALRDWITYHGAEKSLVDELPALPVGTAYVWSPQWLGILQKIRVGEKKTFDASATPKVGGTQVRRDLKPLNLDDLKERMAATIEKAKQDNPKELRKQIAELERQLRGRTVVPDEQGIERAVQMALGQAERQYRANVAELERTVSDLSSRLNKIISLAQANGHVPKAAPVVPVKPQPVAPRPVPRQIIDTSGEKLSGGERKILTALAQYPEGRTKRQVAVLTGYAVNGGAFNNYLSSLRTKGYIERSDLLRITDDGLIALGDFEPLPIGEALRDYWRSQVGKAEREILDVLVEFYPDSLTKQEIAARTPSQYESSGGGFNNAVSHLRTLELIQGRGELKASDELF